MDKIKKLIISVALSALSSFYEEYGFLILLVIGAIIFDIITGILKAKITHEIDSNKGFRGFWRKISLLAGLAFGIFLDIFEHYLITEGIEGLHIAIPISIPIGLLIGVYIILNESISICENLYACGFKLPTLLTQTLKIAKKAVDDDNSRKE